MRATLFLVPALGLAIACGGGKSRVPADVPGDVEPLPDVVAPPIDVQYADAADAGDPGPADPGRTDDGPAADLPGDGGMSDPGGFVYACTPLAVESCLTDCDSAGRRKCLKKWGPCIPPAEFCGNCVDDNCDGLVNEGCPPNPDCEPPVKECPVAVITVAEGGSAWTGDTLHLSAAGSYAPAGAVATWEWSVQAPAGAAGVFLPTATVQEPTFTVDAAGEYLFQLDVRDDQGTAGCARALAAVSVDTYPPVTPEAGCADGTREGFLDSAAWPQIAACAGAWDRPGVTPDTVAPTCGRKGGNSGSNPAGTGCASADLCATGWHVCNGWQEVAQKSTTGCAGAAPADAKPKSLFFALRQPSASKSVCGAAGDGYNDVFGCGNLGTTLGPDKNCGPLDRVLASTQANSCGFNEAEPNLGPWECKGTGASDLNEGANVTKKACQSSSCSYDGYPVGPSDKGGVLCCRDGG
jgi:hypothetical protein